jgi:hypothetical protein
MVLWTSRDEHIAGPLVEAQRALNVARMTDEAKMLLEAERKEKVCSDDEGDATALLAELDWLPLAVSQAAAYVRMTSAPITDYLSKLKRGKERWGFSKRRSLTSIGDARCRTASWRRGVFRSSISDRRTRWYTILSTFLHLWTTRTFRLR